MFLVISFHHKQRGILGFTVRSRSPTMHYIRRDRIFLYFSHFIVFHLPPVQIPPHSLNLLLHLHKRLAFPFCLRVFVPSCCVRISSEKTNKKNNIKNFNIGGKHFKTQDVPVVSTVTCRKAH